MRWPVQKEESEDTHLRVGPPQLSRRLEGAGWLMIVSIFWVAVSLCVQQNEGWQSYLISGNLGALRE